MRYILLFLCILFFLIPYQVHAQEISLSLSPLQHQIMAKPGSRLTVPYTLKNYGDATLVTIRFVRLEIADSLGNYTLVPLEQTEAPEPQLSFTGTGEDPFLLLAKEEFSDSATVEIPAETKEQDYYYALVARSHPSQGFETSSSIKLHGGVAAPFFISVTRSGTLSQNISPPAIQIHNAFPFPFETSTLRYLDSNRVTGSVAIENKGKNITNVKGNIILIPSFPLWRFNGYSAEIPSMNVLANSRKSVRLPEDISLPPGRYILSVSISHGISSQTSQITLIVFPFVLTSLIAGAAIISLAIFFGYKRYTRV